MFSLSPHANDNVHAHTRSRGRLCRLVAILFISTVACLFASHAMAAKDSAPTKQAQTRVVQVNVSAAQAARAARREYGGKVLGVILEAQDQSPYYQVKLLSGGQVRVVRVTAHQ